MMLEEFYASGGPVVSDESYEKIQDVYTAYNRFVTKGQIASFCREHGSAGIEAMMEPLEKYRSLKKEVVDINRRIEELQARIEVFSEMKENALSEMDKIAIQCDLSSHWREWA